MIRYECTRCDFGIGGYEPDDAEDAFDLHQEIAAHEEMHHLEVEAAGSLNQRDGRARGDEQVVPGTVVSEGHDDTHGLALGESLQQLTGRIKPGLADLVGDAIENDAGHDAPPPSGGGSVGDEHLRRLAAQGLVILPSPRNPVGASPAAPPGWAEGLDAKVAETERRRAEWEASLLTRDDARSLVRTELVKLLRLAELGDLSLERDHTLSDLLERLLEARDGSDFRGGSAVLLEVTGDGQAVRDVASHESSPSVVGRSSPTVGDGQVAEGCDTSSATAAAGGAE